MHIVRSPIQGAYLNERATQTVTTATQPLPKTVPFDSLANQHEHTPRTPKLTKLKHSADAGKRERLEERLQGSQEKPMDDANKSIAIAATPSPTTAHDASCQKSRV